MTQPDVAVHCTGQTVAPRPSSAPMSPVLDCTDPRPRDEADGHRPASRASPAPACELVVLPTDTVYGIGADAFAPEAVRRAARGQGPRPRHAAAGAGAAPRTLDGAGDRASPTGPGRWSRAFWPGPLTLVCTPQPSLQWDLGDTRGTVAVRMPDHAGRPRAARARPARWRSRSANLTGQPAATDGRSRRRPSSATPSRSTSTAARPGERGVDDRRLHPQTPVILREGAVTAERLQEILGDVELGH